jgi:hypothetical protein
MTTDSALGSSRMASMLNRLGEERSCQDELAVAAVGGVQEAAPLLVLGGGQPEMLRRLAGDAPVVQPRRRPIVQRLAGHRHGRVAVRRFLGVRSDGRGRGRGVGHFRGLRSSEAGSLPVALPPRQDQPRGPLASWVVAEPLPGFEVNGQVLLVAVLGGRVALGAFAFAVRRPRRAPTRVDAYLVVGDSGKAFRFGGHNYPSLIAANSGPKSADAPTTIGSVASGSCVVESQCAILLSAISM